MNLLLRSFVVCAICTVPCISSATLEAEQLVWPDAQEYGLSPGTSRQVYEMLTTPGSFAVHWSLKDLERRGEKIAPFLMFLIPKGDFEIQADGQDVHVSRWQVRRCLAMTPRPERERYAAGVRVPVTCRSRFAHLTNAETSTLG